MFRIEVNDTQVAEWRRTGHPYKVVAAEIAEWTLKQERGTVLPGDEFFAGDLPIVASTSTWKRAKTLLVTTGVIRATDRAYQVG